MRMLALVIAVAACSGKGPPDPVHTAAGPKPCERMADHVVGLMLEDKQGDKPDKKRTDALRETADAITRVLIERCSKDAWTQDAQKCFLEMATIEASDQCAPLLTVDQRNGMDAGIDSVFGKRPPSAGSGDAGSATTPTTSE